MSIYLYKLSYRVAFNSKGEAVGFWLGGSCHFCNSTDPQLTVLVVTSPILSHPSTELIERVFMSFLLVPGLAACKKILLADAARPGKAGHFYIDSLT